MGVLVGRKAPNFKASAVINGEEIVDDFSLDQFHGKNYVILFFYPKDFTFVCPTELHAFQEKLDVFKSKGVEIVAVSTDTEQSHWGWLQLSKDEGGIRGITYPLVADTNKTISTNYDVIAGEYDYNDEGELIADGELVAYRGLFLIDKIRFSSNFDRVKRALQLTEEVMQILTMRLPLPASTYPDAYALLKKTRVEGNFLSEDELDQLRRCLVLTHDLLSFLNWHKEDASGLF